MTSEQLRAEVIQGIDTALGHPLLIPAEGKRVLAAMRRFWSDPDAPLDKLLGYYLLQERQAQPMALATVAHEVPQALVDQYAVWGVTLPQIEAAIQEFGPVVIEVLQWVLDHTRAGTVTFGAVNWSGLLAIVQKYGPVAIQVITWVLTVVPK